ncbi:septum site-determining protein MinC [Lachnospiraceae bacterium 62-35]
MHNTVVIKGNRSGLSVYLDPDPDFQVLLHDIAVKFKESARFWGSVQMALTLEGRQLTPAEEFAVVNTITENSQIEILCLLDTDARRIERCEKALNDKLMELNSRTGQFYRGDLLSGEAFDSEASIVIIGNVFPGARVTARGNIIVLGELRGSAYAGVAGSLEAVVVALDMAPAQIKIADSASFFGGKGKRLGRGPMIAAAENNRIVVKPLKKGFLNSIKFS